MMWLLCLDLKYYSAHVTTKPIEILTPEESEGLDAMKDVYQNYLNQ
jgi:hypothetical protein